MPNGYIIPGQSVENQSEDKFTAATFVVGASPSNGGRLVVPNIAVGSVAFGSLGTNTTDVAGQFWLTDILVPYNRTITKVGVLQGGTATTDNILVAIWDSFGNLVASSAVAGSVLSGANTFQELTLVLNAAGATITSVKLLGPQRYFIGVQGNGTAAGAIRTVAASTFVDVLGATLAGTFGTIPASITVPTTFTANNAPIVYVG
jgi:hypothetical protein